MERHEGGSTQACHRGGRAAEPGRADVLQDDYLPKCRKTSGAAALPKGADWYAWRVRVETTTDMTSEQVHQLGLAEVKRIRAEMDAVARKAGQPSREAMIQRMRTDPAFYAKTRRSCSPHRRASPRSSTARCRPCSASFRVYPTACGHPGGNGGGQHTAYYFPGSARRAPPAPTSSTRASSTSGHSGSSRPSRRTRRCPATTNQIALQQRSTADFRRYFASFTAFTEGWGLYSERLGIELGLYDTPEKDMGRLSYEMWRACRLVVDTGLHAKRWTKAQAVAFMKDNTALTDANIDAEVNRYITMPGQALGYKIGELRLRALRQKAETALGSRFDVRAFHDAVLAQGSVPLDVLDSQVDAYVASAKAAPAR
jgi:uncharacterized protein (DUF885 family)